MRVSDGVDTCGRYPVAAAHAQHAGGTRTIVNVIGFDLASLVRKAEGTPDKPY